jgi:homoserine kinase
VDIAVSGDVPVARGFGFSAALRLGILAGLSELTRIRWDKQRLLEAVTQLEGHPDNASPAIFGGFTVSTRLDAAVRCLHFPVTDRARFIALIPEFGISTEKARQLVPASFSKVDTVHSLNRAAFIAAAFASGKLELLRGCFDDRLHQPYREQLIPQLSRVIQAGEAAGAIGGFLSGSGSAIICVSLGAEVEIAKAMQRELPNSAVRILIAANEGFQAR